MKFWGCKGLAIYYWEREGGATNWENCASETACKSAFMI